MSDWGFPTIDDAEGWTTLPTGIADSSSSGIENVYVTPAQTLTDYSSGSGWGIDQFGKALQYGVDAYGKIMAIQHSGAAQYNTPPGTGIAPAQPPSDQYAQDAPPQPGDGTMQSTFMDKLTDFSTPVPYAVGLVAVFGVLMLVKVARS